MAFADPVCEKVQENPCSAKIAATSDFDDVETDVVRVCGLELRLRRKRDQYYAACAGNLPVKSTGVVLWECGLLLAEYLGYVLWVQGEVKEWWMLHPPAPVVPSRFWSDPSLGTVLEMGSGCGLVAATLANLGARVMCTDGDPAALATAAQTCREKQRSRGTQSGDWGDVKFARFCWGNARSTRCLAKKLERVAFIVGSDLLYGDSSPPGPLLDSLAVFADEPSTRNAEVILAVKNRCRNETVDFCREAEERGLWTIRLAEEGDFPPKYDASFDLPGFEQGSAYSVIHMVIKDPGTTANVTERSTLGNPIFPNGFDPLPDAKRLRCDGAKVDHDGAG